MPHIKLIFYIIISVCVCVDCGKIFKLVINFGKTFLIARYLIGFQNVCILYKICMLLYYIIYYKRFSGHNSPYYYQWGVELGIEKVNYFILFFCRGKPTQQQE